MYCCGSVKIMQVIISCFHFMTHISTVTQLICTFINSWQTDSRWSWFDLTMNTSSVLLVVARKTSWPYTIAVLLLLLLTCSHDWWMQEVITLTKELVESHTRSSLAQPDSDDEDEESSVAAAGSSARDEADARAWLSSDVTWKSGDKCRAIWSDNHQ